MNKFFSPFSRRKKKESKKTLLRGQMEDEVSEVSQIHITIPSIPRRIIPLDVQGGDADFSAFCSQPTQRNVPRTPRSPRILSQVLANGKRAHIIIKEDPEIEKEQEEFFRATVLGALSPEATPQCREDMVIALDVMKAAKEKYTNKRSEGEGELANLRARNTNVRTGILIGQFVTTRKRDIFAATEEEQDMIYQCLANDLASENIAMTYSDVVELKAGTSGATLFAKLNYRSVVGLVPDTSLDKHIAIAQELVSHCFPENTRNLTALVSEPRVRIAKTERMAPLVCKTMYLIWPYIVIHDMRQFLVFWKTLDMRISAQDPFYSNIVDAHIDASTRVRIRKIGCYRVTRCKHCKPITAPIVTSSTLADFDFSDSDTSDVETNTPTRNNSLSSLSLSQQSQTSENSRSQSPFQTCYHCVKGKVISPYETLQHYAYLNIASTTQGLNKNFFLDMPMLEQLQYSCIVRTQQEQDENNQESVKFQIPDDAPNPQDRSHTMSGCPQDIMQRDCDNKSIGYGCNFILYATEAKKMRQLANAKTNEMLIPQMRPDLFMLCTKVIRTVNKVYEHLVASQITIRHGKNDIFVNVQGKNQKFCFLYGAEHVDNRVAFVIRPKSNSVFVQCFFPECQRIMNVHSKIQSFNIHSSRSKRYGSAAGSGTKTNLVPPKESLLPEQVAAIDQTKVEISVISGWRIPLHEAVNLVYMGKKTNECKFKPPKKTVISRICSGNDNLEHEPKIYDTATGVDLPRSLIPQSLANKVEYLATQNIAPPSSLKTYHTQPGYVPSVQPSGICVVGYALPDARKSQEERRQEYFKIRAQNKKS